MTKKWLGHPPKRCDVCNDTITDEFFDVKTHTGQWGNLCRDCFDADETCQLGVGLGQLYVREDDVWENVA